MNKPSSILLSAIVIIALGVAIYFALRKPEQSQVTQSPTQTVVGDPAGAHISMTNSPKNDTVLLLVTHTGAAQIIKALQLSFPTQQSMPTTTTLEQLNNAQGAFQYIANAIFKKYPDLIPKPPIDTAKKK